MRETIAEEDRFYIDRMRGLSILRVVLMHLGLAWIFTPYSQLLLAFLPVLFFVSGAVSYFSYLRSSSLSSYLFRRLTTLVLPYYLITLPIIVGYLLYNDEVFYSLNLFYEWLTFTPSSSLAPFSLAHLWFIHALVVMMLISVPLFVLSKKGLMPLIIVSGVSFALSIAQSFVDIKDYLIQLSHNFYQPLSCYLYYLLGAIYYSQREVFTCTLNIIISASCALFAVFSLYVFNWDVNLANHSYSPDLYYTFSGLSAIFMLLAIQKPMTYLLKRIYLVDWIIMLFCANSYAIYIVHPALITATEVWLGLEGVHNSYLNAAIKVAIVTVGTVLISIPITRLTNKLGRIVKQKYVSSEVTRAYKV